MACFLIAKKMFAIGLVPNSENFLEITVKEMSIVQIVFFIYLLGPR
jgi:hypothetical protein